ncbi:DUF2058 domain-containing protein [Stenotrophomonas sp. PS02289]|uniref:DUF2058 domain-containing protein n=1 Tax=Stenotrophomonas sp. PS02289 TaxID=2991422 RepID=UPI00249A96A2|nr:DUF2058 domain-containing protein [Stenotrophomonas sp. PS02289]
MAKGNPLQQQLLKAGLVKKSQVSQAAREQEKARHGKGPVAATDSQREADRLRAEKAERDRAIEAERKAKAQAQERQAQIRQIIETQKVARDGDSEYRFNDGTLIRTLLVNPALRRQLAAGSLVIVRFGDGFELVPRAAADKIRERDAGVIVLDNGQHKGSAEPSTGNAEDDAYYAQFEVPDDLIW